MGTAAACCLSRGPGVGRGLSAAGLGGPVAVLASSSLLAVQAPTPTRTNPLHLPASPQFAALININLAVVNLLPLPALDGRCGCGLGCMRSMLDAALLRMAWVCRARCRRHGGSHPPRPPRARTPRGAGSGLALLALERARGRPLDRDVEDLWAAFGQAFVILVLIWLVTSDLESLGAAFMRQVAAQPPAPPGAALPLVAPLPPPPGRLP